MERPGAVENETAQLGGCLAIALLAVTLGYAAVLDVMSYSVGSERPVVDPRPQVAEPAVPVSPIEREAGSTWVNSLGMTFRWIPPGSFLRPSNPAGYQPRVTLSRGFWLGAHPVTQEQWSTIMGDNPSRFEGLDHPVENVSWFDAQDFVAALSDSDPNGASYRLPTEAEWEHAARAGSSEDWYGPIGSIAWYRDNSKGTTQPVGFKDPNAWGLYDMLGNVWEWCQDWHGQLPDDSVVDPEGPHYGSLRVLRGGSWRDRERFCRAGHRSAWPPTARVGVGLRLVALGHIR